METVELGPCDPIMAGSKIWPAPLQNSLSLLLGPDGLPCLPYECNLKGTLTLTFTA